VGKWWEIYAAGKVKEKGLVAIAANPFKSFAYCGAETQN
jgi:hypothetical protein